MTQAFGKVPLAFNWHDCDCAMISAHKIGGPKGIGALVLKKGTDLAALIKGGGQEMGRRSGTENVIAIAGFAAAVKAAQKDLDNGIWDEVAELRDYLEKAIVQSTSDTICMGQAVARLPNTSCLVTPGWKGDTQVMQLDLNGIAVSAGSACSSGKVKSSRVLIAMGLEAEDAACGLRVSLGSQTTRLDVERFVDAAQADFEAALAGAFQAFDEMQRGQGAAVDAHEQVAEFVFQGLEWFVDQHIAAGVVHRHVFLVGLEVAHFLHRHQLQAARRQPEQRGERDDAPAGGDRAEDVVEHRAPLRRVVDAERAAPHPGVAARRRRADPAFGAVDDNEETDVLGTAKGGSLGTAARSGFVELEPLGRAAAGRRAAGLGRASNRSGRGSASGSSA